MSKLFVIIAALAVCIVASLVVESESKLLRSSRYFDDSYGSNGYGMDAPYGGATGERAIITVRGARNPYDGSAPAKIAIEDNPYRGPYPRGVYDRLDSGYGRGSRYPMHSMRPDYGYGNGYGSGYGNSNYGGYNGGYGPMYGAPNRLAVTGAFPYGYGSRFA